MKSTRPPKEKFQRSPEEKTFQERLASETRMPPPSIPKFGKDADSKTQDNISEMMAEGVNISTATATAIDIARGKKNKMSKKQAKPDNNFYETPWRKEKQTGRVGSGRALLQKKKRK